MRLKLIAVTLVAVATASAALADPVGKFKVQGTNPDDSGDYTGTVSVTRTGETYKVVWTVGETETIGIGLGGHTVGSSYRLGPASPQDNVISIAYNSGEGAGIALYTEDADGVWHGVWALEGEEKSATETWTSTVPKTITKKEPERQEPEAMLLKVETPDVKATRSLSAPLPVQSSPNQ
ncbi:hypothetical protein JJB09_11925 [Rhizobium sp. KVB221]|uniref:Uncharacterized protein n=1 Tax=Rhizobium setariae TaxID=2801340 RepID=A0A936YR77_9HYPH|nr:hypothetical protein [Rhizobium setariae]MBL0372739.1 hypothetical protein [Rhizobium setariae]